MPYNPNQRDYVADSLMAQKAGSFDYGQAQGPLASGMAGLGSVQMQAPGAAAAAAAMQPGMPQTPAGGVPGSGLATAGPSNVQLPPQRMGMQGAMPNMPTLGGLGAPTMGGMGQQRRRPGMPY